MFVYLAAGAYAGITYLANENESPTALIAVATAWAAQASAGDRINAGCCA
jgi:hypothetical protein